MSTNILPNKLISQLSLRYKRFFFQNSTTLNNPVIQIKSLEASTENEADMLNTANIQTEICSFQRFDSINRNKEIFIAEYNSLRGEIHQRLSQQTTICQIAITAWGLILGYAFTRIEDVSSYNDVYIILAYPLLAFFISYGWAFNNTRICQIGGYLRKREKQLSKKLDFIGWENYIHDLDKKSKSNSSKSLLLSIKRKLSGWISKLWGANKKVTPGILLTGKVNVKPFRGANKKVKPGIAVLPGTQALSIIVASLLIVHHGNAIDIANPKPGVIVNHTNNTYTVEIIPINQPSKIDTSDNIKNADTPSHANAAIVFLFIDVIGFALTIFVLRRSNKE